MSDSIVKTLGQDISTALDQHKPQDLSHALENVMRELKAAGALVHDDAEDALSNASRALMVAAQSLVTEVKAGSEKISEATVRDVKAHPLAAAAAIATVAAALVGLVLASRKPAAT